MNEKLAEMVKQLAIKRGKLVSVNAEWKELFQAFEEQHSILLATLKQAKQDVSEAEAELRRTTLEHFAETGERKPHPALGIRAGKVYEYLESDAKAWAIEHNMGGVLKLDKHPFEKLLEAGAVSGIDYEELSEATATIAIDLRAYLRDPSVPF